jgi:hypothetical protein
MPTGTFKTFFKGFVRRTQRGREETYLAQASDLLDLEHRQQELDRRNVDQRPLIWQAGPRVN